MPQAMTSLDVPTLTNDLFHNNQWDCQGAGPLLSSGTVLVCRRTPVVSFHCLIVNVCSIYRALLKMLTIPLFCALCPHAHPLPE